MCTPSVPEVKTPEITPPPPVIEKENDEVLAPQDAKGNDRVKRSRGTRSLRVDANIPVTGSTGLSVPV